jgi:hypothetical protein
LRTGSEKKDAGGLTPRRRENRRSLFFLKENLPASGEGGGVKIEVAFWRL